MVGIRVGNCRFDECPGITGIIGLGRDLMGLQDVPRRICLGRDLIGVQDLPQLSKICLSAGHKNNQGNQ